MATPPSGASTGGTSGGPTAPNNPMAPGTDLYNYIGKLSLDVQAGLIDINEANRLNALARSLADNRGNLGAKDRPQLRYGAASRRPEGPTGPGTGSTGPTPPKPDYTPVITDSESYLNALLYTALGVRGLGRWASGLWNRGASATEIVQAVRYGLDQSDGGKAAHAAYLAAFPGMDEFLADGTFYGEAPEAQYIAYRNTVRSAATRYGIDSSLTSDRKIYKYLKNGVDAEEITSRMSVAATAVATTPQETITLLKEYYNVSEGDLISFFLDPDETEAVLQQRYTAARIGTEAVRQNFGIDVKQAEDLLARGYGAAEAATGFQEAASRRGLMTGAGETATEQELIGASFGNQAATETVGRIAGSRVGRFQEGGGFAAGQEGISGLGSATR